jgi:hypothetical protein
VREQDHLLLLLHHHRLLLLLLLCLPLRSRSVTHAPLL